MITQWFFVLMTYFLMNNPLDFYAKNVYVSQKSVGKVTPYVKETPRRTSGKFFKSPPEKRKQSEASLSWLDSSADPYGFADDE